MSKITDTVYELCKPLEEELDFEIVDVDFMKAAGSSRATLVLYVYTESGVDLDFLEKVHRRVDKLLDSVDITDGAPYDLNVSSPGLDRPLKSARDFERNLGVLLEIKLYAPENGVKLFVGTLKSFTADTITVELDDKAKTEKTFNIKQTAKISQAIIFD